MLLFACAALAAAPQPAVKAIEVKILDHRTGEPLPALPVEVTSSIPIPCLRPPCPPSEQTRWQGSTDDQGVLAYPASLDAEGAVVFVHAVGSDFAADVHGDGKRDARGRPVLRLERPGRAGPAPCIFTSEELAARIGQPLRPPEVKSPKPPYSVYCTFEAANARGKKLIVSVRAKESKEEFTALMRMSRMTGKDRFAELQGVGRGAYLAPHGMRVWDGERSLYVNGLTGILKREITPAEATALLQLGLGRLPPGG